MALASVSAVMVLVFLFGLFLLLYLNVEQLRTSIASQMEIHAYLNAQSDTQALKQKITALPNIRSVTYVSKEEAFRELQTDLQDHITLNGIIANPLPPYFSIKVTEPEKITDVAQALEGMPGVTKVNYLQKMVSNFVSLFKAVERFLFGIIIFLLGCALLIIYNTIRLGVFSRYREIKIMQLVGASYGFIQWPFLLEGAFYGLMGALLAILFLEPSYTAMTNQMTAIFSINSLVHGKAMGSLLLELAASGVVVGALGSFLSVNRYLRY